MLARGGDAAQGQAHTPELHLADDAAQHSQQNKPARARWPNLSVITLSKPEVSLVVQVMVLVGADDRVEERLCVLMKLLKIETSIDQACVTSDMTQACSYRAKKRASETDAGLRICFADAQCSSKAFYGHCCVASHAEELSCSTIELNAHVTLQHLHLLATSSYGHADMQA